MSKSPSYSRRFSGDGVTADISQPGEAEGSRGCKGRGGSARQTTLVPATPSCGMCGLSSVFASPVPKPVSRRSKVRRIDQVHGAVRVIPRFHEIFARE